MTLRFVNDVQTRITTSGGISATDATVDITAGHGATIAAQVAFASGEFCYATLKDAYGNRETIKITGRSTDTLTIGERAIERNDSALVWAAGTILDFCASAKALEMIMENPLRTTPLTIQIDSAAGIPLTLQNDDAAGFAGIQFKDDAGALMGKIGYNNDTDQIEIDCEEAVPLSLVLPAALEVDDLTVNGSISATSIVNSDSQSIMPSQVTAASAGTLSAGTGGAEALEIDLGSVTDGDIGMIEFSIECSHANADSYFTASLAKKSGTGACVFGHDSTTISRTMHHYTASTAPTTMNFSVSGILEATTTGTLVLKITVTAYAGTVTAAAGAVQARMTWFKKA